MGLRPRQGNLRHISSLFPKDSLYFIHFVNARLTLTLQPLGDHFATKKSENREQVVKVAVRLIVADQSPSISNKNHLNMHKRRAAADFGRDEVSVVVKWSPTSHRLVSD